MQIAGRLARTPILLLAAVAVFLAVAAGTAGAVGETEPNDSPATASELPPNTYAVGSVDGPDHDYWRLNLTGGGTLVFTWGPCSSCFTLRLAHANNTTLFADLSTTQEGANQNGLNLLGPEELLLEVWQSGSIPDYTIRAEFDPAYLAIRGSDEVEPNQDVITSMDLPIGTTVGGKVDRDYTDLDYWRLVPNQTGWANLEWSAEFPWLLITFPPENGPLSFLEVPLEGAPFYFNVSAGQPVYIVLSSYYGRGAYTLKVLLAPAASTFSAGSGEAEPNDDPQSATLLVDSGDYEGFINNVLDPADFYRVDGSAGGDLVYIRVSRSGNYVGSMAVSGFEGPTPWQTNEGEVPPSSYWLVAFLISPGAVVFRVTGDFLAVGYSVNISRFHTTIYEDGRADISEVENAEPLRLRVFPRLSASEQPTGLINLGNGESMLFGESLCGRLLSGVHLPQVEIEAGQVFVPDNLSLPNMVASRNVTVDVPWEDDFCFRAMTEKVPQIVGDNTFLYRVDGRLEGDPARVMAEIDASSRDTSGGQLALWAMTSSMNRTLARAWGATNEVLGVAVSILDTAGLNTTLQSSPEPPPTPNPPTNNTNSSNPPPATTPPPAFNDTINQTLAAEFSRLLIILAATGTVVAAVAAIGVYGIVQRERRK